MERKRFRVADGVCRCFATRMIPRLAMLVLLSLLCSCGGEVDLSSVGTQPLTITKYQKGSPVKELRVSPPGKVYDELAAWATEHKKGWKTSYVSYAPGILVRGTNFRLNVLPSGVVLNIGGRQYERDRSVGEFGFLSQ
jgi:hypothetical protein